MSSPKLILGLILGISALVGLMLLPVRTLEVTSKHRGAVVWRARAAPGDVVTFSYIHSIENIPVEGRFAIEADGMLRVVETRFASYGAGLPPPSARSADGKWLVAPGGEKIPRFSFYMAPINQPRLHVNDRTLDLAALLEPGDVLTLSSARFPWLLMCLKHPEERP
ncbi:MAG: DUF1850 domain-containing protein [Desulfobacteraceae bacterium]|nr:MAG: DUF1850 domain-containing protein [Desulfobacteraceae bacterium]RPJ76342.1 MAG: DUF1850 domain-containing protein [Desulfobacteraceae bacterium]